MLLRSTGGAGHWLEVNLRPFVPGAVVTLYSARGDRLLNNCPQTTLAGSLE